MVACLISLVGLTTEATGSARLTFFVMVTKLQ